MLLCVFKDRIFSQWAKAINFYFLWDYASCIKKPQKLSFCQEVKSKICICKLFYSFNWLIIRITLHCAICDFLQLHSMYIGRRFQILGWNRFLKRYLEPIVMSLVEKKNYCATFPSLITGFLSTGGPPIRFQTSDFQNTSVLQISQISKIFLTFFLLILIYV